MIKNNYRFFVIISVVSLVLLVVYLWIQKYHSKQLVLKKNEIDSLEKKSKRIKKTDIPLIQEDISKIKSRYGEIIKNTSKICEVSEDLIIAFIYCESAGDPDIRSRAGAIGLMQLEKVSVNDMIWQANQLGQLNKKEIVILKSKLGSRLNCILSMRNLGDKLKCNHYKGNVITNKDLEDPEFNVLAGTIFLEILIDKYKVEDSIRLDQVRFHYVNGLNADKKSEHRIMVGNHEDALNYILKLK